MYFVNSVSSSILGPTMGRLFVVCSNMMCSDISHITVNVETLLFYSCRLVTIGNFKFRIAAWKICQRLILQQ